MAHPLKHTESSAKKGRKYWESDHIFNNVAGSLGAVPRESTVFTSY
jgi:hypothetical protein